MKKIQALQAPNGATSIGEATDPEDPDRRNRSLYCC